MGSIPTLVRVFLCPCVGPFPFSLVGLTLTWFIWGRKLELHITLLSVKYVLKGPKVFSKFKTVRSVSPILYWITLTRYVTTGKFMVRCNLQCSTKAGKVKIDFKQRSHWHFCRCTHLFDRNKYFQTHLILHEATIL